MNSRELRDRLDSLPVSKEQENNYHSYRILRGNIKNARNYCEPAFIHQQQLEINCYQRLLIYFIHPEEVNRISDNQCVNIIDDLYGQPQSENIKWPDDPESLRITLKDLNYIVSLGQLNRLVPLSVRKLEKKEKANESENHNNNNRMSHSGQIKMNKM